jgi:simple sugar transport system ATP-binding protein
VQCFDIKVPSVDAPVSHLSGGNLQRLILGRELSGNPAVLVAAYPTQGLDVAAVEHVHRRLLDAKSRGTGVLLISHDLDEILALSDRVAVIFEGQIVRVMDRESVDARRLGLLMTGLRDE